MSGISGSMCTCNKNLLWVNYFCISFMQIRQSADLKCRQLVTWRTIYACSPACMGHGAGCSLGAASTTPRTYTTVCLLNARVFHPSHEIRRGQFWRGEKIQMLWVFWETPAKMKVEVEQRWPIINRTEQCAREQRWSIEMVRNLRLCRVHQPLFHQPSIQLFAPSRAE